MITRPYRLLMLQGTRVLFCLVCDTYSANAHDIAHHYCGRCHLWLDDLPEDYRRPRDNLRNEASHA